MEGKAGRESLIHEALTSPHFLVLSGGGPTVTDCAGIPWSDSFANSNGDLTVDIRSDIAAESRAKIVYEYLMQFTDDPLVKESLGFLMTREIAHFQQFTAALSQIEPNFPPGVLQGDPRFTHTYFNMSDGKNVRGPWNQGQGPWQQGEEWAYIEDPVEHVRETQGLMKEPIQGTSQTMKQVEKLNEKLSRERSNEVNEAVPTGENQWSEYPEDSLEPSRRQGPCEYAG